MFSIKNLYLRVSYEPYANANFLSLSLSNKHALVSESQNGVTLIFSAQGLGFKVSRRWGSKEGELR